MKKFIIVFVLLVSSSFAQAQVLIPQPLQPARLNSVPLALQEAAKIYLTDGQILTNQTVNANGYMHGIEMNVPGTAYLINVGVENAGSGFVTADQRHGDGRGVVASVPGAHIIVTNGYSNNNSEDGYRAAGGGKITIINSQASGNLKNGFFAGVGGTMVISGGQAFNNLYGAMGANGFLTMEINGGNYYQNKNQGLHIIEGEEVIISGTTMTNNNTSNSQGENYGGMSIFGVKDVKITGTEIDGNFSSGLYVESNTAYNDAPVRVTIEDSTITNNGTQGIKSFGDSQVTITTSTLEGLCIESADPFTGQLGIIYVNGASVDGSSTCP